MGNFASKMTRISLRPTNRGIIDFGELYYVEQTDLKEKKTTKKKTRQIYVQFILLPFLNFGDF